MVATPRRTVIDQSLLTRRFQVRLKAMVVSPGRISSISRNCKLVGKAVWGGGGLRVEWAPAWTLYPRIKARKNHSVLVILLLQMLRELGTMEIFVEHEELDHSIW